MNLLEVKEVSKTYGSANTQVTALDNVSFELGTGRMLAVLGPSGSGKTTLLSIIAGLLAPSSGEIRIKGSPVSLRSPRDAAMFRRKHVGIVFQEYHLMPYLTAADNLLLVPRIAGRVTGVERKRADSLLAEFGLAERASHMPSMLSGGERQRVAIARALMNDPEIMLVDEPTAHLDTERGRQVVELVRSHIRGRDMTCVMVTHDERMVDEADEVLRLVDGQIV
ncbi:MAG: ABC transporter ATP-binding protein [Coriobacteriia bacterium]|jgi:putative ABC transport system ATP-binding protein|nr:ABC transporter ATP-binding protein [Coriobacteriia bacterium]